VDHQRVLDEIVTWATQDGNIRAVILTGSVARGFEDVHPLSDLDVELYVREPDLLLQSDAWYRRFGRVLVVEALPNPGWHPTRLVYFVDGKIDFMVGPVEALSTTRYVRPFRILVDKDGAGANIPQALPRAATKPDAEAFNECINWFYAAALMCAKCVVRDEPWQAKWRDWDLKSQLMRMIDWDHRARRGWNYDTWSRGKHLKKWIGADVLAELDACWAGFDRPSTVRALRASVELFERLSSRTANELGWSSFDPTPVRREIDAILRHPWE
jgi:aminoglycoside 6-adenylyltransferase